MEYIKTLLNECARWIDTLAGVKTDPKYTVTSIQKFGGGGGDE